MSEVDRGPVYGYPRAAGIILDDVEPGLSIEISLGGRYGNAIESLLGSRGEIAAIRAVASVESGMIIGVPSPVVLEQHRAQFGWTEEEQRAAIAHYVINGKDIDRQLFPESPVDR
jgi:hypothetical protein